MSGLITDEMVETALDTIPDDVRMGYYSMRDALEAIEPMIEDLIKKRRKALSEKEWEEAYDAGFSAGSRDG